MSLQGLFSLAETPEELLSRGYGTVREQISDPAFGNLKTNIRYQPAPFIGARPFVNMFDLSPYYFEGQDLGFNADLYNPSFGGISGYRDSDGSILDQDAVNRAAMDVIKQGFRNQGIMNQAPSMFLDDAGLPAIDTSFGVANEPDVEEDVEKAKRSRTGIGSLINILRNIPTPLNLLRRGLESLSGFNQRIRNTDFGRSSTLSEFLQRRRDRKAREEAARIGAEKQKAIIASQQVDTGDGPGSRPGGFGTGAGDFNPSDPTATEGSF